jgi:hypothetical protein
LIANLPPPASRGRRFFRTMTFHIVMAGLVSAIHVFLSVKQGVDARDKRGHD